MIKRIVTRLLETGVFDESDDRRYIDALFPGLQDSLDKLTVYGGDDNG